MPYASAPTLVEQDVGGYVLSGLHFKPLPGVVVDRPAVVLDSGLAANALFWSRTSELLAERGQEVVAVHRPGYGPGDPPPEAVARGADQIVDELRQGLMAWGFAPPYVLGGHSLGAIHMLRFAQRFPHEVAGLLLVDPSHPEMLTRVRNAPSGEAMARNMRFLASLHRVGLLRFVGPWLIGHVIGRGREQLSPNVWAQLQTFGSNPQTFLTAARESEQARASFAAARTQPGSLGDLPLEILSAGWWVHGAPSNLKRDMMVLRKELALASTRGRHTVVPDCEHANLPILHPQAVADGVERILGA